ncbi:MAG TPA: hypothetical protein DIW43_01225 [Spongiibacteraceae bacterium]|nr:hypothetical protein [Spongiibacteraceae bacterium]HCS26042.1 hypothetical protein [Spongiibacteraceae bacterium]
MDNPKISTSALARQLEVPVQQLFGTLKDYDWIRKIQDGWALTPKGEFEGGEYKTSKRYGRYIVWPAGLEQHPMLQALENNKMLSAAALGESVQLSGRAVNRCLAELGWLKRELHGWILTAAGKHSGGVQMENRQTDMLYALWPAGVAENPVLAARLQACAAAAAAGSATPGDDLFANQESYESVDGHGHDTRELLAICHWLYMAGVLHATQRQLPVEESLKADFYLPVNRVYIDYWSANASPAELKASMRKAEAYKNLGLAAIEIHAEDVSQLDDVMPRQLHKFGVQFT